MAVGYKSGILTGIALSVGAAVFGSLWRPALARYGRPLAKGAVKRGLAAYEVGRGRLAELGESVQDLVAEAQIELVAERTRHSPAGSAPLAQGGPADLA